MKKYTNFVVLSMLLCSVISYGQVKIVTSVVGGYVGGLGIFSWDGAHAYDALFYGTSGIAVDRTGNLYVGDANAPRIGKVDAGGIIHSVAGTGIGGFSGDGGPATAAQFSHPGSLCVDNAGNIYVADVGNSRIRKITAATGIITTVAGGGTSTVDGVPATTEDIGNAKCVAVDASGTLYLIDSTSNIRIVNPATGIITSLGISAGWMVFDAANNLYYSSGGIKKRTPSGTTTTVAGTFGGSSFCRDSVGNIYYGTSTWTSWVWMIDVSTGQIDSIAGCGGLYDEGIPAIDAYAGNYMFCSDKHGNIYYSNNASNVREIPANNGHYVHYYANSFKMTVNELCGGPQVTVATDYYLPGANVKIYYGDGQTGTVSLSSGCSSSGVFAVLNHIYALTGSYTIKAVLYAGTMAVDSLHRTYNYVQCRSLPVKFYGDVNGNCVMDTDEAFISLPILTEIDSNGVAVDTISSTNSFYYIAHGPIGTVYGFKPLTTPAGMHVSCPSTGIMYDTISASNYASASQYVALACNTSTAFDLNVNAIIPVTGVNDEWGNIYVQNNYCMPENGTVTLHYSTKYAGTPSQITPTATSVSAGTIVWNVGSLTSSVSAPVNLHYAIWRGTTPLTVGDTVHSYVTIDPIAGDANPSNNAEIIIDTIRAGCDPNEMWVNPSGCMPIGNSNLQYTIHFENTGNDTAFNIYVMDTLSNNVDPKSLRVVMASAQMNISVFNSGGYNIAKFDFPDINLLDSSHHGLCDGAVIFTINTNNGMPAGTAVYNRAGIYFDYNAVVMTNTVENITDCITSVPVVSNTYSVQIYPNPTTDELSIKMDNGAYSSVTISNSMGQVMVQEPINNSMSKIDVKMLPAGLYYVTLRGENGSVVEKFVKM